MPSTLQGDIHVAGHLSCQTLGVPAGTLTDSGVSGSADIGAGKMRHRHKALFQQNHGTAAVAQRQPIYTVRASVATIQSLRAALTVAITGDSTITIDLLKNGSSILSSTIVLDSTNAARSFESAVGFISTALVANDFLEVVVTVSAGTGTLGQGLVVELEVDEKAS